MTDDAKPEVKSTTLQIIETIAALMTAAFGFVAALAWNEAIKALIAEYFSSDGTLVGQLVYAVIVTVVAVIAIVWIGRVMAKYKSLDLRSAVKKK
ncbi:DUF5654 family protein [Methanomassiliicoccus luminyensis]|uniref:DUF5654 family protein n=1 Tax=Methanomassiliicoccus luminyensis TaxID=1080712 RepID=UPI0003825660|nr:DUF5654 family protein [Methanomassiliicoccus luminyensis]